MKPKYIIAVIAAFLLASIPLGAAKYRDYKVDSMPIDTIKQGGHLWDIVHSPTCKCHK